MNWSMYTADRNTHLKIVVVGLTAALLIAVIGIATQQFNLRHRCPDRAGPGRDQSRWTRGVHRPQRSDRPLARRRKRMNAAD